MRGYWTVKTPAGAFYIRFKSGWWRAYHEDHDLGFYNAPEQALHDLTCGRIIRPIVGDPSKLQLPTQLDDWQFMSTQGH
jgi:hypothetical protein